jgi:mono/diheme cytochrome c family protein
MNRKWRVLSGFLFLLVLVSVVLVKVTPVYSSNDLSSDLTNPRLIQKGRDLVTGAGHCAACHSPNRNPDDPQWLAGYLSGTSETPFQVGEFQIYPSNITPDEETGIGSWTPQQVFNVFRRGQDKHGNTICPPMFWDVYRNLSDRDTWSIVAYLKEGIKPVNNNVPENTTPQGTRPDCTPLFQNIQPLPDYPGKNEIGVWRK